MQNKNKAINPLDSFRELNTTVVLVSNLSRNLTKKHLNEIFSAYGALKGVYIPKDEESKMFKNYAYLEYSNKEDAEKACLYLSGGQIDGLRIKAEILNAHKNYPDDKEIGQIQSADNAQVSSNQSNHSEQLLNKENKLKSYTRRRRSKSRSRKRSQSNPAKSKTYTNSLHQSRPRNRSRSNNRKRHRDRKESYSSSSAPRSSSSERSSIKSTSS